MIVDTSAMIAIVRDEPEKDAFLALLAMADEPRMSAGSWIELEIVLTRRGTAAMTTQIDTLFRLFDIRIEPVSIRQASLARDGYRQFGRGAQHPADLNFGDCFAYALAKDSGRPLLFKGDDFTHTDIVPAIP